jgi:hypothetical protein
MKKGGGKKDKRLVNVDERLGWISGYSESSN